MTCMALLALIASPTAGPFESFVAVLQNAKTLQVEAKVTLIGGGSREVKLLGEKPDRVMLGGNLLTYSRASVFGDPAGAAFLPFWDEKAFGSGTVRSLGTKTRQGKSFDSARVALQAPLAVLTLYLDPATHLPKLAEYESGGAVTVVDYRQIEVDVVLPPDTFAAKVRPPAAESGEYKPRYRLKGKLEPGEVPYKKLTLDDFAVREGGGVFDAVTAGFCRYSYRAAVGGGGTSFRARVSSIDIVTGFSKKDSWRSSRIRGSPAQLLEHEQGHLDLHEIHTRELLLMPLSGFPVGVGSSPDSATSDLDSKLASYFRETLSASQKEADQYDRETSHGRDRIKQDEWTALIRKRLLGG